MHRVNYWRKHLLLPGRTDDLLLPSGKTIAPDGVCDVQDISEQSVWLSPGHAVLILLQPLGVHSPAQSTSFQSRILAFFVLLIQREH